MQHRASSTNNLPQRRTRTSTETDTGLQQTVFPIKRAKVESVNISTDQHESSQATEGGPLHQRTIQHLSAPPVLDRRILEDMEIPIKTCLLQPYQPSSYQPDTLAIARPVHGVQHACRTAIWALALLQLRRQLGDQSALDFPDTMIPLLLKTCLFHDSGREGDGEDKPEWERASGNNLAEHLRNSGAGQVLAWQCGKAIQLKDKPNQCQHLPAHIQTLRSLLCEADTLDVMRVRQFFYMDGLECFKACQTDEERDAIRTLAIEACKIIANQGDLRFATHLQASENAPPFYHIAANLNENTRKNWEHHPHPLCLQLQAISSQSNFIQLLLQPFTGNLKPDKPPFSFKNLTKTAAPTGSCNKGKSGVYRENGNGQRYYIKEATCRDDACNQVLMANIARLLGLKVPDTLVHEEEGKFFVVSSWMDGLQGGQEALNKLPQEQWAKLLIINVIVGNEDITNSSWQNIELTSVGEPVMFDWDHAGVASRYIPLTQHQAREDDFSSMPVLLKILRDPNSPALNSSHLSVACKPLLAQLTDEQLSQALADILSSFEADTLNQLIEHSGFRAGDRTWLRQTLWDRMAWLSTRFPQSRGKQTTSSAEYRAIEASGTRGGWLLVKNSDIPAGQVCIEEYLDHHSRPQTRMTLRLSRKASNRLSDNLAIERTFHRLQSQIRYLNCRSKEEYKDWRSDLLQLSHECGYLAEQLRHDKKRWASEHHQQIEKVAEQLAAIAESSLTSAKATQYQDTEQFPVIPDTLPAPAFPARVTSRSGENSEAERELAEHHYGFSRLTGKYTHYSDVDSKGESRATVRVILLPAIENESGSIQFYAENLPEAKTFEHKLIITMPGHSQCVVETLFRELHGLGIQASRPDVSDLEQQWLDALANYHGCFGEMSDAVTQDISESEKNTALNLKKREYLAKKLNLQMSLLDWECHCRIRTGRLVFYRPGYPHGVAQMPSSSYCPSHNISYATNQRSLPQVMDTMLHNEAALTSFERRADIGLDVSSLPYFVKLGAGAATFVRICARGNNDLSAASRLLAIEFKPSTLGRLDASIFTEEASFKDSYGPLTAHCRNKRKVLNTQQDYQNLVKGRNTQETLYTMPLSMLDELSTVTIGDARVQRQLLHTLKRRYNHWPDGRPVEDIFQHSRHIWFYELTDINSTVPCYIREFIKECGIDYFEHLINNNPDFKNGKLINLDNLTISPDRKTYISNIDFRHCSMNNVRLSNVEFHQCHFTAEQFETIEVKNITFKKCIFTMKIGTERAKRTRLADRQG